MTKVLVTGAGGFVGQRLGKTLQREGMRTVGISRSQAQIDGYDRVYGASFGESLASLLEEERFDAVVHCANYIGDDELRINVEGTQKWLDEAERAGIGLQVFLSSVSAKEDALADYGRSKFMLEKPFLEANQVVLRIGLIVGNGGMFERMIQPIRDMPAVPVLDNGSPPVYPVGVDTLCNVIRDCIANNGEDQRGRRLQIHHEKPTPLRDIMVSIRRHFGYSCLFVPVPSLPILWGLLAAERIPFIKLPITSTNLRGLRQSRNLSFNSDLPALGYADEPIDDLIKAIAAEAAAD